VTPTTRRDAHITGMTLALGGLLLVIGSLIISARETGANGSYNPLAKKDNSSDIGT
jgi:hypothetical protein